MSFGLIFRELLHNGLIWDTFKQLTYQFYIEELVGPSVISVLIRMSVDDDKKRFDNSFNIKIG